MQKTYRNFIGIDIGKEEFVIFSNNSSKISTYINNPDGFKDFFISHKDELKDALVVLESTGGYEINLAYFLLENSIAVHRADTRKVKNFIRSLGQRAKTDAIDAKALSQFGLERQNVLSLFIKSDEIQIKLKALAERRHDLKQMCVQEKNRYKSPLSKCVRSNIRAVIDCLEQQILKIEEETKALIESEETLREKVKILRTVPGIGEITSTMLVSLIPELGNINRKQIASLCGVAPYPQQRGKQNRYRRTFGGRQNIRPILYMAAMGARRRKGSDLAIFFERLVQKGKKPIVALVAVMRKIVVIANARLKEHFHPEVKPGFQKKLILGNHS